MDEEMWTYAGLAHENGFSPACLLGFLRLAGTKSCKAVHLLEKSVINMMWLVVTVLDCPVIMIGPGGLLLVVPTCLQSPFQYNGWGCKKVGDWLHLGCEKILFWRVAYWVSTGGDAHSLSICGTLVRELLVQRGWRIKGLGEGDGLG
jgi:hypothetical protein